MFLSRLVLLLTFIVSSSIAGSIEVVRDGASILLTDPSCDKVREIIPSFRQWTASTRGKNRCPSEIPVQMQKQGVMCEANITHCVPDHVAQYEGRRLWSAGPNCFNLALVLQGILPGMRYVDSSEMNFYMSSPLCRQLASDEARSPGDIGVIHSFNGGSSDAWHGFIYVGEDIAYSKNGFGQQYPFSLQPIAEIYRQYEVADTAKCVSNLGNPKGSVPLDCTNYPTFYRCMALDDYLENSSEIPGDLLRIFESMKNVDRCLEDTIMKNAALSQSAVANIFSVGLALTTYLKEASGSDHRKILTEKEKFLLNALALQLNSISTQLYLLRNESDVPVSRLSYMIQQELQKLSTKDF